MRQVIIKILAKYPRCSYGSDHIALGRLAKKVNTVLFLCSQVGKRREEIKYFIIIPLSFYIVKDVGHVKETVINLIIGYS